MVDIRVLVEEFSVKHGWYTSTCWRL